VVFKKGIIFSIPGIFGVLVGAELGLLKPCKKLLFIFAILMIIIAIYMLKRKYTNESENPTLKESYPKHLSISFIVGFSSGYFGIGGGFLIVPGLIYSAGLNIIQAVGTSLISVGLFGFVTALRYSFNGDLNLLITSLYIAGGILGGWIGTTLQPRYLREH